MQIKRHLLPSMFLACLIFFGSGRAADIELTVCNFDLRNPADFPSGSQITAQKNVVFKIRITDQTEFEQKAWVWIAVPLGQGKTPHITDVTRDQWKEPSAQSPWLETKPVQFSIDFENPEAVYQYDLINPGNLEKVVRSTAVQVGNDSIPKTRGAYWGMDGTYNVQYSNGEFADSVLYLSPALQANFGVKEFVVVVQLTRRFFGDHRYFTSYNSANNYNRFLWDHYPPSIYFDTRILDTPHSGDTVDGPFNVRLNEGILAVCDRGRAIPTSAKLYMIPNPLKDTKEITLDDVLSKMSYVFEMPLACTTYCSRGGLWAVVPQPSWPSGKYAMAIVTEDHLGNRGIAPVYHKPLENENPRILFLENISTEVRPAFVSPHAVSGNDLLISNSANGIVDVTVVICKKELVQVKVFDLVGKTMKTLFVGQLEQGSYQARWKGTGENGRGVASGPYVFLLEAGSSCVAKKCKLMR